MSRNFIFEIGVEELPAAYAYDCMDQLKDNVIRNLKDNRLDFKDVEVFGTPRRLTIVISDLAYKQKDLEEELKGPSKNIAVDSDGNLTKAAMGFLKGKGLTEKDIFYKDVNGSEYLFAIKNEVGADSKEILKSVIPDSIKSITFPKTMHWGGLNLKFARPIRWTLALLDNEVVEIDLETIISSNITNGHRFLGEKNIDVKGFDDYFKVMEDNYVILDHNKRREIIEQQVKKVASSLGGEAEIDDDLLDEVNFLVEYPTAFYGEFDRDYLDIPKQVVITPMKQHQRYFPVLKGNKLLPYFVGVRNGSDYMIENVKKGNEKVLEARLADALFFYKEDLRYDLDYFRDKLKTVVFQDKLGTIYEKTERLKKLAPDIFSTIANGEDTKNIFRAAEISKADLVTQMVFEFDELQGYMGQEYSKVKGENIEVAKAIYEHYLPRFSGDILPDTKEGQALSIADKMDSICGFFAIGIQPTGSQDPYALRRQALGVLNIIKDKKLEISMAKLISDALDAYDKLDFNKDEVKNSVTEFLKDRIKNMLKDMDVRYDVIDAVLAGDIDNIYEIFLKAYELNNWVESGDIDEVLVAFNRVSNLAMKAEDDKVNPELLNGDPEVNLNDKFAEIKPVFASAVNDRDYTKALDLMTEIKPEIDAFFENIMVMDEDIAVRNNRLAILKNIYDMMLGVCDLSKIVYK